MPLFLHIHTHEHEFSLTVHGVLEVLKESVTETVKMLPFLFLAFLILELLEHHAMSKINTAFKKSGKAGPLIASLLGCIPQCGFSVLSANLYSGGIITLGTLIAVFLATSDEAIILLMSSPDAAKEIAKLVITKIIIAVVFGYIIDFVLRGKCHYCHEHDHEHNHEHSHDLCEQDHCGCDDNSGVFRPAVIHTAKVFGFLLLFTVIIDFTVAALGTEKLSSLLLTDSIFQPILAALVGFIPNCATSVLITQLYIEGAISFGAVIAGLCTNAGAGLLVLFRNKAKIKENVKIAGILYICSIISGIILHLVY